LEKTNPSSFRIGDIVEAVFSIVVVPVKQKKYQMMLVLRALTLLDSHHTMVSKSKYRTGIIDMTPDHIGRTDTATHQDRFIVQQRSLFASEEKGMLR
jgi:hypothetical protein